MRKVSEIKYLNENVFIEENAKIFEQSIKDLKDLDEGLLSSLLGGAAGFLIGPTIGKALCKALGIERGVLWDLLNSKLVTTAIGATLANTSVPDPIKSVTPKK